MSLADALPWEDDIVHEVLQMVGNDHLPEIIHTVFEGARKWQQLVDLDDAVVDRAARALHAESLLMDGPEQWVPDYDEHPWVAKSWRARVLAPLIAITEEGT